MRGAAGKMALDLEDDGGCAEPEALPGRPPEAAAAADAPAPRACWQPSPE